MQGIRFFGQWKQVFGSGELAAIAREAGFGKRNRKLTPRRIFWTLVLGFGAGPKRCLAELSRFFMMIAGIAVTRQALHKRFTGETVLFLELCLRRLMERAAAWMQEPLPDGLERFEGISLFDSTTLRLFDRLARKFRACRKNVRLAALKIHARMSLSTKQADQVHITGERVHDRRGIQIGEWVRGCLLTFDLGYFDYGLFKEIVLMGGHFVSRLKERANGVIVMVREGCKKGRSGRDLNGVMFQGYRVDLDVRFGQGTKTAVFRVVAIWDRKIQNYHWYVTSLAPEDFSPREVAQIYRLRWQIELLFKEWKSICRIQHLPSTKEEVVLSLVYASLCAAVLSRLALWLACQRAKLSWHSVSTYIALCVLWNFATLLGEAILLGRKEPLKRALDRLLSSLALVAVLPNRTNAVLSIAKEVA